MTISRALREQVRHHFQDRCGYCQSAQKYVFAPLEIDHIFPVALGGTDDAENLCLCCPMCNAFKGLQIESIDPIAQKQEKLFNPRTEQWDEHFRWDGEGTLILGLTPIGRATVTALNMNNLLAVTVRREWIRAGWHPPTKG